MVVCREKCITKKQKKFSYDSFFILFFYFTSVLLFFMEKIFAKLRMWYLWLPCSYRLGFSLCFVSLPLGDQRKLRGGPFVFLVHSTMKKLYLLLYLCQAHVSTQGAQTDITMIMILKKSEIKHFYNFLLFVFV